MISTLAFPSIYLLATHLTSEEFRRLQAQIPSLEHDSKRADVIVGKLSKKERAQFELRCLAITTEEVADTSDQTASAIKRHSMPSSHSPESHVSAPKRRRTSGTHSLTGVLSGETDVTAPDSYSHQIGKAVVGESLSPGPSTSRTVKVVKLAWFNNSITCGKVLPLSDYIIYEGRIAQPDFNPPMPTTRILPSVARNATGTIFKNIKDAGESVNAPSRASPSSPSPLRGHARHSELLPVTTRHSTHRPTLARRTNSDYEESRGLPPIPDCLHAVYSCQRSTPLHPPNEKFIDSLKKIQRIRELMGDEIGVRAYSTAIASLAAYPHVLSSAAEVSRLPGCGPKIAELYREYSATGGHVQEADDAESDPKICVLRLFCDIWGVAEATARSFHNRGWRDLDDVVEFGWSELGRVQQIGVKYYDELQMTMTRAQVKDIANTVLEQANQIFPGFQMVIAGGYRRGKKMNGDVDVILSHPDEEATHLVIGRLVLALERIGRITHTLTLSTANSERAQVPVSWKGNAPRHTLVKSPDLGGTGGAGFDTLDKALVVWQEPIDQDPGRNQSVNTLNKNMAESEGAEGITSQTHIHEEPNHNPHRRVDIIISPWKSVGCAVLGWSGGTTFQRDLRRYCKRVHGLRFDSSGVRSRVDGSWVDLEDFAQDPAPDMLTAERRVFTALGLEWRPPEERCTG
ncbi:hypothetical protein CMQ_6492 [Grosmannia clavigera kw1407]|uniref:DNA polymerase n=1 Tax=Grosmannia clavigera (strain kw1407 / UAMH 11150) TaxID=655863 RepID=F0XM85_GROCL|nr:uncharacterized protein CMQ_6492 [Grosmannia clavigera kw1407]EFX01550.1 hypothetical protein CMQ_6492 [Grosmannia clavigera kw1407]